jgi:hypothetical protein
VGLSNKTPTIASGLNNKKPAATKPLVSVDSICIGKSQNDIYCHDMMWAVASTSAAGVFFNSAYSWLQQHGCIRIHDMLAMRQLIVGWLENAALALAQHVP